MPSHKLKRRINLIISKISKRNWDKSQPTLPCTKFYAVMGNPTVPRGMGTIGTLITEVDLVGKTSQC